jgi:hypothetical protein
MTIVYDAVEEKVKSKYFSFDFTISGEAWSMWYDPDKHDVCFDCWDDDIQESLRDFLVNLKRLIYADAEGSGITDSELEKFAFKYLKASVKVKRVLNKIG